jgi:tripeptidyl-peptidase-1
MKLWTWLMVNRSQHDSPKYGQHYTPEEIIDIFAPAEAAIQSVRTWLESSGIAPHRISQSVNKQWIQFDAKVHEVEGLLKTQYHTWEHKSSDSVSQACTE